jgi:hypothetical protein
MTVKREIWLFAICSAVSTGCGYYPPLLYSVLSDL